jgi:hypothetical protein
MDDRVTEVRFLAGERDFFSSPYVQIGSEAHPDSHRMGSGSSSSGGKAAEASVYCRGLHGVVFNELSTGITLLNCHLSPNGCFQIALPWLAGAKPTAG